MSMVDTSGLERMLLKRVVKTANNTLVELVAEAEKTLIQPTINFKEHTAKTEVTRQGFEAVVRLRSDVPESAREELVVLLTRGTSVRKVALANFKRQTTPNSLSSTAGEGGEKRPLQFGRFPGIKPRNWDLLTAERLRNIAKRVVLRHWDASS